MAVLSLASTTYSSHIPFATHCNTGSTRLLSLRKGSHFIKCTQNNQPAVATSDTINPSLEQQAPVSLHPHPPFLPYSPLRPYPPPTPTPQTIKRSDFPSDFIFGCGTSALQTEGAYNLDGKGLSLWDVFTKERNLASIDVACDSYHRYKEDIALLKEMGVKTYRFSISWPRILPTGRLEGGINSKGIDHYNDVINELVKNGIEPFVTVFHFDMPIALEYLYGGFLSRRFVQDFKDYCDICFEHFGDRVKNWILINEILAFANFGYDLGHTAPGRGSLWSSGSNGNSAREPYIVTHNLILAQATAAKLYKDKYKDTQGGEVGTALMASWLLPHSDSVDDQNAAERARDFKFGWFLNPLLEGEYPISMKYLVRDRLPTFTYEEKKMIKGSLDFVGINYYSANYVKSIPITNDPPVSYSKDIYVETTHLDSAGVPIGPLADGSVFVRSFPDGLRQILVYLSERYQIPKLYITENGTTSSAETNPDSGGAYRDRFRIKFIKQHLTAVKHAIDEGANVKGYFYWSLIDSFEFMSGYSSRFGICFTNFTTLERDLKLSAEWYRKFLEE